MLELWKHRPSQAFRPEGSDQSSPRPASVGSPFPWPGRVAAWLRSTAGWLGGGESAVDRLAGLAASAREPEEVRVALVRLAWEVSGAAKVELFGERDGKPSRRLACWPPCPTADSSAEARSIPRGPLSGSGLRALKANSASTTLQVPLKAADSSFGTLRLTRGRPGAWSPRVVRRLASLCAVASTAERGLARPSRGDFDPSYDPGRGPHGSAILTAFLGFAQAQARRRHESLSMLEVSVDRLDSIRELLGDELAEAAIERVTRAIRSTVRASDVVARLEEGRVAVLLPNASAENAINVAESVRQAIARAGSASTTMPSLTASIGVATYPEHAHDVASLRAAASSTLTQAREQGHDRIAVAPSIPPLAPTSVLHHRVG
jgi:diguanylate cyclase (GGDEF)-like protein